MVLMKITDYFLGGARRGGVQGLLLLAWHSEIHPGGPYGVLGIKHESAVC